MNEDKMLIVQAPKGIPTELDMAHIKMYLEGTPPVVLNAQLPPLVPIEVPVQEPPPLLPIVTDNMLRALQEASGSALAGPPPVTIAPVTTKITVQVYKEYGGNTQTLRKKSLPVDVEDASQLKEAQNLIRRMWDVMVSAGWVGLAAPQLGVLKRIVVLDGSVGQYKHPLIFINPEVVFDFGGELQIVDEGCLSLPGTSGLVKRPKRVQVKFFDGEGKPDLIIFEGILATAIQHEIDHLNGLLYIDRMSRLTRETTMKKYRKGKA